MRAVLFIAGLALGFGSAWLLKPEPAVPPSEAAAAPLPYTPVQARAAFLARQARMFGDADTLIIGDSLVEQADWTDACGRTFAAGIGGARVAAPLFVLPDLLRFTTPETVVIALGTNYFIPTEDLARFRQDMPGLIDAVGGVELVLVGVPGVEKANRLVARWADQRGATFVEPPAGPMRQVSQGVPDGYHYTHEASLAYRAAISEGCARANAKSD